MARTMAVNAIVVMEAFYLLSIRYAQDMPFTLRGIIGTRAVAFAITGVAVFQIIFTYTPFMNHFFGSEPLALDQGLAVLALGLAVMLVLEAEKFIIRKIVKTV
jgi:magnesium-transporting ATPase (P-type)